MVTKEQIIKLRDATGLGIVKCHKALNKAEGDFEKALELLRKEGDKLARKRVHMAMHEGRVFVMINSSHKLGSIMALTSETDFVANSQEFKQIGNDIISLALLHHIPDKATLINAYLDEEKTVQQILIELSGKFKENIAIKHYMLLKADYIGHYVHTGSRLGSLVGLKRPTDFHGDLSNIAKKLAIQVVTSDPIAIDVTRIPTDILNKEKEIIDAQLKKKNKPPHIIDKIAQQKLQKFIDEHTLLPQRFFQDEAKTIQDVLQETHPDLNIINFARVQIA